MGKQYHFKRHGLHDKLSSKHKLLTPEALEAPNRDRLLPLFFVFYHNRVKPIRKYTKYFSCGTQRNQPWTYQEAVFILTSFHSAGKHQGRNWRRKEINYLLYRVWPSMLKEWPARQEMSSSTTMAWPFKALQTTEWTILEACSTGLNSYLVL